MATVTRPNNYVDGATTSAAEANSNETTLYNLVNGALDTDNLSASAGIKATQMATIATAGKVSGAALTSIDSIPAGAGVIPIANLATGTPDGTQFIRDDGTLVVPGSASAPTGTITMWGGAIASPPAGWLICNGAAVSQAGYAALYAILGTKYGVDTGGNFTLPNFSNKFAYGANEGASAGNASVGSAGGLTPAANDSAVTAATGATTGSFSDVGSGSSVPAYTHTHNAMPPYLAVSFIIKT
jgi:microcystin-dependent protein